MRRWTSRLMAALALAAVVLTGVAGTADEQPTSPETSVQAASTVRTMDWWF